jgi:hypothetical protein
VNKLGCDITDETPRERAWAAELRERIRALKAGEMKLLSEEEADAEVEELLGK